MEKICAVSSQSTRKLMPDLTTPYSNTKSTLRSERNYEHIEAREYLLSLHAESLFFPFSIQKRKV
jgi:hypothetical protein